MRLHCEAPGGREFGGILFDPLRVLRVFLAAGSSELDFSLANGQVILAISVLTPNCLFLLPARLQAKSPHATVT